MPNDYKEFFAQRPWQPQDLLNDLQEMIDGENASPMNERYTTLCMARDYLKKLFNMTPMRLETLKSLVTDKEWVWIEILDPSAHGELESAYYRRIVNQNYPDNMFCCGYPNLLCIFPFEDYNKTWTAFAFKPETTRTVQQETTTDPHNSVFFDLKGE